MRLMLALSGVAASSEPADVSALVYVVCVGTVGLCVALIAAHWRNNSNRIDRVESENKSRIEKVESEFNALIKERAEKHHDLENKVQALELKFVAIAGSAATERGLVEMERSILSRLDEMSKKFDERIDQLWVQDRRQQQFATTPTQTRAP